MLPALRGRKQAIGFVRQSVSIQTGDTGDLDQLAILSRMSIMEVDVSIVAAYLFMTDTTRTRGNFSLKRLFLQSSI